MERTWDGLPVAAEPPHGAAVIVFARTGEGIRFLLLHRGHMGLEYEGEWAWGPPAGARLPGEAVEVCAARELCEETGLELELQIMPHGRADWFVYSAEIPGPCPIRLSEEHDRYMWADVALVRRLVLPARVRQDILAVQAGLGSTTN